MKRVRVTLRVTGILFTVLFSLGLWASSPRPVASVDPLLGPPPTGGGDSWSPILTPDGRYLLFASMANNLAAGSNGVYQRLAPPQINVFLRDRTKGTTLLVSVNTSGTGGGNGNSIPTALSTNGQYALFESSASDLVTNDGNNATDVFLRDLVNNQTILVSVNTNGRGGNGASQSSTMSPDGRYIAFSSLASDMVAGDTNGIADIFVRDRLSGTTMLASPGAIADGNITARSDSPVITPDGRYVAFLSTATGLASGDTNVGEVYVRDLIGLTTVSASAGARSGSATSFFFNHAVSDDGQYVVFESGATTEGTIYRYDLSTTALDVVSTNGVTALTETMEFRNLDMTPDGRFVTYVANAGTISSVYVWDGQSNSTTLVSTLAAAASSVCALPGISSNGQYVAYQSSPVELAPITYNTNSGSHLYLWNAATGSNTLVDMDPGGGSSFDTFMSRPFVSPDGQFVVFDATDSNLGGDPRASYYNVYLSDQTTNTIEVISARQPALPSASARALGLGSEFSVSSNGEYVAYSCVADRIAAGASNDFICVFVSDLWHGSNVVASVDTNGVADPDGACTSPVISGNGRYVAFTSTADNLVTNSGTGYQNVFVRDLQMETTALVSVIASGGGTDGNSTSPLIDASGRYVLFSSVANDLGRTDNGHAAYLYFRDLQAGTTVPVPGTNNPVMTPDGHYVGFGSQQVCLWDSHSNVLVYSNSAANVTDIALSPDGSRLGYTDGTKVYAVDRAAKSHLLISTNAPDLTTGPGLQFSGNGRYLVYVTAQAIAANDTNNINDIYRWDFLLNTNLLISQNGGAIVGNGPSDQPAISWDGRFVAYRTSASNLVAAGESAYPQIYLYDSQSNVTSLASASALTGGAGNNRSRAPIFSSDSSTLLIQSWASDLSTNDFSGSAGIDAFAVEPPALVGTIQLGAGGFPVITWPAASGMNYRAQYKDNLTDPIWLPLPGGVTVISNTGSITDSLPNSPQRFYRIQSN